MRKISVLYIALLCMPLLFTSCEVIGDIFKAGFWTAIIVIVLVVALIIWLIRKAR